MSFAFNLVISAVVISASVMISKKNSQIAGFIIALPISTLLVLALGYTEQRDPIRMMALAKSVFFAIPLSLLFFVPFFFAERLRLGFWTTYVLGILLLVAGYIIHKTVMARVL